MAQRSYPWGGEATGDAAGVSPYSANTWSYVWSLIFNHQRREDGVVPTDRASLDQLLRVFESAGVLYLDTGVALVDGTVYMNDATINLGTPGEGSYSVVLRKDYSAQTVTAAIRYFGVVQNSSMWEIKLADVVVGVGSSITITDQRRFINVFPKVYKRQGGSASDWGTTAGTTNYSAYSPIVQAGSGLVWFTAGGWVCTQDIIFARPFSATPIVIVSGSHPYVSYPPVSLSYHHEVVPTVSGMTVSVKRDSNAAGAVLHIFNWMAIGPG